MSYNMNFISRFTRRCKVIAIGVFLIGFSVILLRTPGTEDYNKRTVGRIRTDVSHFRINSIVSADSFKKMATIIDPYSRYTTTEKTSQDSKHTLSAQLKSLIETNKNIYRNDLKEKQFNSKDEQELNESIELENSDDAGICMSMISESRIQHDVTYFVFPFSYDPLPIDVTLLSHLTLNRGVRRIEKILAHWPGPASVSVIGTDDEVKKFLNTIHSWKRNNVGIHVVYQRNTTRYPVNFMRNVALYGANTSHIWMVDADFTPNKDAYQLLKKHIPRFDWTTTRPALVTAALETKLNVGGVPENKTKLLEKLWENNRTIEAFGLTRCPHCHVNTDWHKFMTVAEVYKIQGGGYFEPYVVVQRKTSPAYDERLIARHMNKILYDYELYVLKYEFYVLPDVYIVHEPHKRINQPMSEWKCMEKIAKQIFREVDRKKS